jgi:hypothetical protein
VAGVSINIDVVQSLFRETLTYYPVVGEVFLDRVSNERYRSVCFEAASVSEATKDCKNNDGGFSNWSAYCNKHAVFFASQIHVGLGWAMAENNFYNESFVRQLDSIWAWRVIDGLAYYKGLFERRDVVRNAMVPDYIQGDHVHAFDEGVGRSLWYSCQGDFDRLSRSINLFNPARHADLLRGAGIAFIFVGGLNKDEFVRFLSVFPSCKNDILCGAFMATASLEKTNVIPEFDLNFAKNKAVSSLIEPSQQPFYTVIKDVTKSISV